MKLLIDSLKTPVGPFTIAVDEAGSLHAANFSDRPLDLEGVVTTNAKNPSGVTAKLEAYFSGELNAIDDLRVAFERGTEFQLSVWRALREVPCGQTWSYGQLARHLGRPSAVRAVGLANGANPVAIVVPCHRVIGADGSLTGYGGGLPRKKWLLAHEGIASHQLSLSLPG
jgi:methylated-DNA-[protein]-cysteine S-methyltransferase